MLARVMDFRAILLVAIPILVTASDAYPVELPDGVTATVIAEFPSEVPFLEKVRLVKVVLQPGAVLDNILVENEEYCRLEQGQLTRTNHNTGITQVFTIGSLWTSSKSTRHTVTNTGDIDAIMWVYQLIEKGAAEGKKM